MEPPFPQTTDDVYGRWPRVMFSATLQQSLDRMTPADWARYRYLRDDNRGVGDDPMPRSMFNFHMGGGRGRNASRPSYEVFCRIYKAETLFEALHA